MTAQEALETLVEFTKDYEYYGNSHYNEVLDVLKELTNAKDDELLLKFLSKYQDEAQCSIPEIQVAIKYIEANQKIDEVDEVIEWSSRND